MSKVGIVFKFEAIRQLKKPTFWISLLLFPLGIFAAIGLSTLNSVGIEDYLTSPELGDKKIGITDSVGLIKEAPAGLISVANEDAGREQVKNGELDIYYHLLTREYGCIVLSRIDYDTLFSGYSLGAAAPLHNALGIILAYGKAFFVKTVMQRLFKCRVGKHHHL